MTFDATQALELLDWKRQVFALYEQVRASSDPRAAWELWRQTRARLFREHPQSPVAEDARGRFPGCEYFQYEPAARVLADVEPSQPIHSSVVASTGTGLPFTKVGTARFVLAGEEHALALLWNDGYGGGLFVSFHDQTSGQDTYAGGRYLLDTVKGADLGTNADGLVLDFNFAYNPSCAYDGGWACPLAPTENSLPTEIRAGEKTPPPLAFGAS